MDPEQRRLFHTHPELGARLLEQVTGSPLDHRPLVQALRGKYGELYGVA